ncbi:c-type cytochrome [Afifella sp. IM 167]|uniref:c-type cytochrome n=1 Tax=Afifella sp. IM 167 TaxID=2033586 RepID=UPI001CC958EB|nr:c-type cytochrome [Afifella sp. IM 167]MBZ8133885.1 hypothetical protein [Afifella sp. IM 167]
MNSFFPKHFVAWLGPIFAAYVAGAIVAGIIVVSGAVNLAASIPHPEGWANLLHYSFERSVATHAGELTKPDDFDADWRVAQGAAHYGHVCITCHGAPQTGQNVVALQMRPQPQYLPAVVKQFSDNELAWIVLHGVKYTGMPSWSDASRADEAWSMAAFLRKLPELDYEGFRKLAYGNDGKLIDAKLPAEYAGFQPSPTETATPDAETHDTSEPATGFSDFAMNNNILSMCGRCHGADGVGRGIGAFPNLSIQDREYLRRTLKAFAAGERHSGFMRPIAAQLTDEQIMAVSAYYAMQEKKQSPGADKLDPQMIAAGREIAENGIPDRKVTACLSCHEQTKFTSRLFPHLDGQYAIYIENQLKLFQHGERGYAGDYDPMDRLAHQLTPDEMKAVAAYFNAEQPAVLDNTPADGGPNASADAPGTGEPPASASPAATNTGATAN